MHVEDQENGRLPAQDAEHEHDEEDGDVSITRDETAGVEDPFVQTLRTIPQRNIVLVYLTDLVFTIFDRGLQSCGRLHQCLWYRKSR